MVIVDAFVDVSELTGAVPAEARPGTPAAWRRGRNRATPRTRPRRPPGGPAGPDAARRAARHSGPCATGDRHMADGRALIGTFIGVLITFAMWVSLWENVWRVSVEPVRGAICENRLNRLGPSPCLRSSWMRWRLAECRLI